MITLFRWIAAFVVAGFIGFGLIWAFAHVVQNAPTWIGKAAAQIERAYEEEKEK